MKHGRILPLMALLSVSFAAFAQGQDEADLNAQLNNPVASLITIPIEYNNDTNIGPSETGEVWTVKFTPVYPFDFSENWNLISRTIFSYVDQDIPDSGLNETGISDLVQNFYFSPKKLGKSGLIWGAGAIFLTDTATEDSLGAGKWGLGPSAVVLKQTGPWTVGALGHYLTDVGGSDNRADLEQIFFQPFLSYNLNAKTSFTLQSEVTWDLENDNESGAFLLFQANRLFSIGSQLFQGRIGMRHWYERNAFGPYDSVEFNARLTLLFPR